MVEQQVKYAQQEIFKAGKELGSAKIRLDGTKYEKDMNKLWDCLKKLNTKLVSDIRAK